MRWMQQSLAALLLICAAVTSSAETQGVIVAAEYAEPTRRYAHAVLGDDIEWGALRLTLTSCEGCDKRLVTVRLPQHRVFEDTAPRLVDMGGDVGPAVVVVESDAEKGARLAIYTEQGFHAGTPFIGQSHRWLAPVGIADLDGDGRVELAYIDRPHLAKTLRVWRYESAVLTEIAQMPGLTNHRIGERDIAGGIRSCGSDSEMIVATADWSRLVAVRLNKNALIAEDVGKHEGRASFDRAMRCP